MSNKFWSELTHRLTPYVPGEQRHGDSVIKLNTNENPYPPSPGVMAAIAAVDADQLRRYPDPESVALKAALAQYQQLKPNQVFVGNGSDEALALAFMAFFTNKAALQFPELSYSFYPVYCDLLNIEQRRLPMLENFAIDLPAFENNQSGIIFPNPNAPTSLAVSKDEIEALLKRVPDTVVLVDEAYVDFGAQSVVGLVDAYPNLIVTQTFSKARALAGMRLGVAYANEELIEALQRVKNSFNSYPIDAVAQAAGLASIGDEAYFQDCLEKVIATRDATSKALSEKGFTVLNSKANFIFVSPPDENAQRLYDFLNDRNVLVRYWPKGVLSKWLRISIGTQSDMQTLVSAIEKLDYS